jgi:hypothetical protein
VTSPFAVVSCGIEVYPFEGGPYQIIGGQIKSVTVSKSVAGGVNGTFVIELAPGGPQGTESSPNWTEIITPGSHVLIGMQRGADSAIVMDGVSTTTGETHQWTSGEEGSTASRRQQVVGSDFAWFFNTQNWYSLAMYGLVAPAGIGGQLGYLPSSLTSLMSQGLNGNGSPVTVGQVWFNKIMAGNGGMLGTTFVPYQGGGTRLPFNTLVSQTLEQYPNVYIPITEQFLGMESWMAKFMDIFPWPWYEFFVTTAPSGTYALTASNGTAFASVPNVSTSGRVFTMQQFPAALPAGPQMVARVNPVPRLDFPRSTGAGFSIGTLDMARWNALPLTQLKDYGFVQSNIEFSSDEARNFYMLNPSAYQTLYGNNGSNTAPFQFIFGGAADPASVHRYGYKPVNGVTRWMYDWNGVASQRQNLDIPQTVATLTAALVSWWHPLPLMARGEATIPLSPSVYIGTRFRYAPFKDGILWDFYVKAVTHRFVFGGNSRTILSLVRGLPTSIYADSSSNGLLQSIWTGNARRQYVAGSSNVYQIGLPSGTGQALQLFDSLETAGTVAQQMWSSFVTPQATQ